jgi:radical SAM protein with 4Fe4S-binding SPASM domain
LRIALSDFTLYLTEECNLDCVYCFQKRQAQCLEFSVIQEALDFFQDSIAENSYITFYGGEPLLAFETIAQTVGFIETHKTLNAKKLRYSISVNGTLLSKEILDFLSAHRFMVNLSHDGTAQDTTRPSQLNSLVWENLARLTRLPNIELATNSVFIPATVREVFRSARLLIESGVKNCQISYSIRDPWDSVCLDEMREEVQELRRYLLAYFSQNRSIPVQNFQARLGPGLFHCTAGQDRLALGTDRKLWGCRFFADLSTAGMAHPDLSAYCFGDIRDFAQKDETIYSEVIQKYKELRQENFCSEKRACRDCPDIVLCNSCPATAAFSTGMLGKIPDWICDLKKIWREEVARFWAEADLS